MLRNVIRSISLVGIRDFIQSLFNDNTAELEARIAALESQLPSTTGEVVEAEDDDRNTLGFSEDSINGIHNETWVGYPLADIPAATWDADNECMTPGEGTIQLMKCRRRGANVTWKNHYRIQRVKSYCPTVIEARTEIDCGDPVTVDMVNTDVMLPANCETFTLTGTIANAGAPSTINVDSDGNSIGSTDVSEDGAFEIVFSADDVVNNTVSVGLTGGGTLADMVIQGMTEIPTFVSAFQDTECCQWWVQPCGTGTGTTDFETDCDQIAATHMFQNPQIPRHFIPNTFWGAGFRVLEGGGFVCDTCEVIKCNETPVDAEGNLLPFTPPGDGGFIGDGPPGTPPVRPPT